MEINNKILILGASDKVSEEADFAEHVVDSQEHSDNSNASSLLNNGGTVSEEFNQMNEELGVNMPNRDNHSSKYYEIIKCYIQYGLSC